MKRRTFKALLCLGLFAMTLSSCGNTNPYADDPRYPIYQLAVEDGFTGTYQEWLDSIKGEDGEDGQTPHIGENGNWWIGDTDTGVPATGPQGPAGSDGQDGSQGPQGEPGKDGTDGQDGIDGKDGTSMLTGEGVPSDDLGKDGDSYIDTNTWDFYVKVDGTWVLKGNIKADGADHDGTEGLEFFPINDTECAVSVGTAKMLKEIVVPSKYKDYTVTTIIEKGFDGSKVENLYLPSTVTSIGDRAFFVCSSLTNVYYKGTIEDWCNISFYSGYSSPMEFAKHFYMLNEYNEWYEVTEIIVPDTVTKIGDYQFVGFDNITSTIIGNSVTSIGYAAFYGCSSLIIYCEAASQPSGWGSDWNSSRPVYWDIAKEDIYCDEENSLIYIIKDEKIIITRYFGESSSINIPSEINGHFVTTIGSSAFYNCSSLTSVTLGNGVTSIGSEAFYNCSSLTSIVIPNSVTSIGSYAFSRCTSLTSITIPDSVTSIGGSAFAGCSSLTSVTLGNGVTSIGGSAFAGCSSLTSVTLGNGATSIGERAFYNCSSLTSITIPDSVTSIGERAFSYCSSLTSITIGNSVTSIGDYAFSSCSSLTSIVIPDSVTEIGRSAFSSCSSLTSIVIPDSVTEIGSEAFYKCSSLTIYCKATSQPNGWSSYWNPSSRPVYWGGEWEYDDNGNPVVI